MLDLSIAITIKVWRRPAYFQKVMEGLRDALRFYQDYEIRRAKLIGGERHKVDFTYCMTSIDHSQQAIENSQRDIVTKHRIDLEKYGLGSSMYIVHEETQGCAGNTAYILNQGFASGADAVIHLEDDTVPAVDFLVYMARKAIWMHETKKTKYFAVCPFNRIAVQDSITTPINLDTSYIKAWFECGGGFLLPTWSWDHIQNLGGIFGAVGNANRPDLVGEAWKDSIHVTDKGSWAWPINQYFRYRSLTEHLCIFPTISRVQNIGQLGGVFNPNARWHRENIYDPNWSGTYPPNELMQSALDFSWTTDRETVLPT